MAAKGKGLRISIFDYHIQPGCEPGAGSNPAMHSFMCQYQDKPLTGSGCTFDDAEGLFFCEHEDILLMESEHGELVSGLLERLELAGLTQRARKPEHDHPMPTE